MDETVRTVTRAGISTPRLDGHGNRLIRAVHDDDIRTAPTVLRLEGEEAAEGVHGSARSRGHVVVFGAGRLTPRQDRKSTRLNSSHEWISYAVFCLKKKRKLSTATEQLLHI